MEQVTRDLSNSVQNYSTNSTYWTKTSSIEALSLAISVGIAVGGKAGVGISGAGAEATNVILTDVNAYASDSKLTANNGNVSIDATNAASIDASVVTVSAAFGAGGLAGVGVSLGVAVARNYIGWDTSSDLIPDAGIDFSTGDSARNQFTKSMPLTKGDLVRIDAGARAGDVYRYVGDTIQADFSSSEGSRSVSEAMLCWCRPTLQATAMLMDHRMARLAGCISLLAATQSQSVYSGLHGYGRLGIRRFLVSGRAGLREYGLLAAGQSGEVIFRYSGLF